MKKTVKIMCVHGLGDHRNTTWERDWAATIRANFPGQEAGPGKNSLHLEFVFVTYDPIFEDADLSGWDTAKALWKLSKSAVTSKFRRKKGVLGRVSDRIKWTAGYVVAWVEDDKFQKETRRLILETIVEEKPDVVVAHSLGSLITYNAFSHEDAQAKAVKASLKRAHYVTLGSQIGNPFVLRNLTPGRITPLNVAHWYHLFNEEDDVFTAPIKLWDADNFQQVSTKFDIEGFADHAAESYLGHRSTIADVWRPIAEQTTPPRKKKFGSQTQARTRRSVVDATDRLAHRALLIGINNYPNEEDRLEGCVNDVFLMSCVLQECGFPPESIRTCLDHRATAEGIIERLAWLLDDPQPNDQRVLYYSGHGASIPEYGESNEPDRMCETLVPWDFDWSEATAVTDDHIYSLYSQLPYDTRLTMIFDCCHSGGIHRDGASKARGLNPPDDIRHRAIKWDAQTQMWVPRDFERLNADFSSQSKVNSRFFGEEGSTVRLGRASALRGQDQQAYRAHKRRAPKTPFGPYLPLIIEACQEEEYSYEYRHGVTSFGAFTYAMCANLRRYKRVDYQHLIDATGAQLKEFGYQQRPQVLGPGSIVDATIPWLQKKSGS